MGISGEIHIIPVGENLTLTVQGDTSGGCNWQFINAWNRFSCCFSAQARGEEFCDPDTQETSCTDGMVVEETRKSEDSCSLHISNLRVQDSGNYTAILPRLKSGKKDFVVKVVDIIPTSLPNMNKSYVNFPRQILKKPKVTKSPGSNSSALEDSEPSTTKKKPVPYVVCIPLTILLSIALGMIIFIVARKKGCKKRCMKSNSEDDEDSIYDFYETVTALNI